MIMFRIYGLRFHPLRPYVRSVHYSRKTARNSSLGYMHFSPILSLSHSLSIRRAAAATACVSRSGNSVRYLQRVIRKAAAAVTAGAAAAAATPAVHVFIRFPIKREIFQF